jgi:hypothetical protein
LLHKSQLNRIPSWILRMCLFNSLLPRNSLLHWSHSYFTPSWIFFLCSFSSNAHLKASAHTLHL